MWVLISFISGLVTFGLFSCAWFLLFALAIGILQLLLGEETVQRRNGTVAETHGGLLAPVRMCTRIDICALKRTCIFTYMHTHIHMHRHIYTLD